MDFDLLTKDDVSFIDKYHRRVWEELSPLLKDDEETLKWLKQ